MLKVIYNFKLKDKQGNVFLSSKELGEATGNAEHSWGILL